MIMIMILSQSGNWRRESRYRSISEEEQHVRQIVYILNKFSVSMEAYHEIVQISSALPRSYLVEGCQKELDKDTASTVTRTPGPSPGAELPLKPLLEAQVRKHVSKSKCDE